MALSPTAIDQVQERAATRNTATGAEGEQPEPILCRHCGRTASNGLVCEGMCVADSGY